MLSKGQINALKKLSMCSCFPETARILENKENTDGQSGEDPKTSAQNTDTPTHAKKHKKKKKKTGDGKDNQQKGVKSSEETPKQETTELVNTHIVKCTYILYMFTIYLLLFICISCGKVK